MVTEAGNLMIHGLLCDDSLREDTLMALPNYLGLPPKDETTEKAEKFVDALTKDVDKQTGGSKKH